MLLVIIIIVIGIGIWYRRIVTNRRKILKYSIHIVMNLYKFITNINAITWLH